MPALHFILATAGHVDHGKSALVKALTGTDPDRLPEEKARGITIDLGFAHLELTAPNPHPATFHLGIVDVPGHEDFVKNMVAGVGSIDLALLVVAADDGWMPQTEEHLQILAYLGVTRAVVALTKIDLAAGREEEAVESLRNHLQDSPFATAPIVPTSVLTGRGLDDLKAALLTVLAETPPPRDIGKPRLPVDRVFTLRGIGTVVTGTLNGGSFQRGQAVVIQPRGAPTRVRSLQNHNADVENSGPGTRTALNLPDVELRSDNHTLGLGRGDVVTLPDLGGPSDAWGVVVEKSARLLDSQAPAARPFKEGTLVRVHHGSGNSPARFLFVDGGELLPGQRVLAQLRFETPVFAFAGDHFIVRDWAEQSTLAGGVVLEPDAERRHWRAAKQRRFLERRAAALADEPRQAVPETRPRPEATVFVASLLERDGIARGAQLLLKSRFSVLEVAAAVSALVADRKAIVAGDLLADAAWWQTRRDRAARGIDAEHRAHPERPGLALNELRAMLKDAVPTPTVFEALVASLCQTDFQQLATAIRRRTHRPALPPHLQAAGAKLRASLAAKPLEPPSRKELAPDAVSQLALRFLLETGEAVDVSPEIVLSSDAYGNAVELIKQHIRQRASATVSDLRLLLGSSRRIVVPLLEKLDREAITQRQGDLRVLGRNA